MERNCSGNASDHKNTDDLCEKTHDRGKYMDFSAITVGSEER
jgi:hypothetical protein